MLLPRIGLALAQPGGPDDPHDLYLTAGGNLAMVHDAEAVGQHARQRLMAFRNEWFLDTRVGVPWLDQILGKKENLPLAEGLIKAEISATPGVTAITEFSIRFFRSNRQLDAPRATVATEYDQEVAI